MRKIDKRKNDILHMLSLKENIKTDELVQELNVSEATVRRTLSELENDGKVIRTHGGVQLYAKRIYDYVFDNKLLKNLEQKKAIGKFAAKMVFSNEIILLDSGTTVYVTAQAIAKRIETGQIKYLRIVTNSIAVADVLGDLCEVIILGGRVRLFRRDIFGPIVERNIKMFRAHKAFIGADGLTRKDGLMTTDENTSRIDEEMIQRSNEVILLIDSSKFEKPSFVSYSNVENIDKIVTDMYLPDRIMADYEKHGVKMYRAPMDVKFNSIV